MPTVIFVTAYDQYALKAFEVNALDYLLKPFDRNRFQKTLERAKRMVGQVQNGNVNDQLLSLLGNLRREQEMPERFIVKSGGRVVFLRVEEIDWMRAVGNYLDFCYMDPTSKADPTAFGNSSLSARPDTADQHTHFLRKTAINSCSSQSPFPA